MKNIKIGIKDVLRVTTGIARSSFYLIEAKGINIPDLHTNGSLLFARTVSNLNRHILPDEYESEIHVFKSKEENAPYSFVCAEKLKANKSPHPLYIYGDIDTVMSDIESIMEGKRMFVGTPLQAPCKAEDEHFKEDFFSNEMHLVSLASDLGRLQVSPHLPYPLTAKNIALKKLTIDDLKTLTRTEDAFLKDANNETIKHFLDNRSPQNTRFYRIYKEWYSVSF